MGFWYSFYSFLSTNAIEIRTELVYDKSMPASRCVAQDCNNGSNPRQGISLHILLQAAVFYQVGRDLCPLITRTSTQPAVLLLASEHFTEDCFAVKRLVQGAILSAWKKNMKTIGSSPDRRMVSLYFLVIVAL